jgi:hypothetical protein
MSRDGVSDYKANNSFYNKEAFISKESGLFEYFESYAYS